MNEIFFRYLHFLSLLILAGSLFTEAFLIKSKNLRSEISLLAKVDLIYGISSITLLAAGLTLWFGNVGKPSIYYSNNWIFLTKIGLVMLLGLLSIQPTIFFIKNRKGNPDEILIVPKLTRWLINAEVALLSIIPLLAGLMSRGHGFMP
ncbi:MAG: DUF2214 family protein [Bacteroidetes bacterium]|nr:DUF2214 family protein [Bacteroidota bacterium]